jgi:hypothetical protein
MPSSDPGFRRCVIIAILAALFPAVLPIRAQEGPEPSKQPPSNPAGAKIASALAEAAKTRIKKVGPTEFTLGGIQFSSATHEIRVPAAVNMTEGILEYALVHENGKTHESLLKTKISPTELNVALLLCNYEPHIKEAAQFLEDPRPETKARMAQPMEHEGANRVHLEVEWKDSAGAVQKAPLSSWIEDLTAKAPLQTDHWTYTGSFVTQSGYAAEDDGSHIAIYFDLVALMNLPNPRNRSDDVWHVEHSAVPPLDTPVTLIISPVQSAPAVTPVSK